jgi:hypothetical protein
MYMFSVEAEYQASLSSLLETASMAQEHGVDPLVISGHLAGIERFSAAGEMGAQLAWTTAVTLGVSVAK